MTNDYIKEIWDKQAETHRGSYEASWGDIYAIQLEIEVIGKYIKKNDKVLDVGCANGFSSLHHIEKGISSITGIDFSEKMILQALKNKDSLENVDCEVFFEVGNVCDIRFNDNQFDVVYSTRVLINLATWEQQKQGIDECIRVCSNGGTVIFSEAFWEPLALLNAIRSLKQLPMLVEHDYNRYLKKEKLESYLNSINIDYEVEDFSSVYYLGSRFLRELVTAHEEYPGYSNPINEIFYNIEKKFSGGGFGIQQAYVIKK